MATQDSGRPWSGIITAREKLLTSPEETRLGFLEQAREKTRRVAQFQKRAHALFAALQGVTNACQLPSLSEFRDDLIAAAGFSDKATKYFTAEMLDEEMKRIFDEIYAKCSAANSAEPSPTVARAFRTEIVQRYLLTRGDTLGGQMRNWTGVRAGQKFNQALLEALGRASLQVEYESPEEAESFRQGSMFARDDEARSDGEASADDDAHSDEADSDDTSAGRRKKVDKPRNIPVRWPGRLLLLNAKPTLYPLYPDKANGNKVVLNNIDMILLDTTNLPEETGPRAGTMARKAWEIARLTRDPKRYIACGELKGGIDPAAADERWKTTKGGLERIPAQFETCRTKFGLDVEPPQLFFVGAAIGNVMAGDVYERLQTDWFRQAANLTEPVQVAALTDWLVRL